MDVRERKYKEEELLVDLGGGDVRRSGKKRRARRR